MRKGFRGPDSIIINDVNDISLSMMIKAFIAQGNPMFSMLHDANFTYDSSMPIYENKVNLI